MLNLEILYTFLVFIAIYAVCDPLKSYSWNNNKCEIFITNPPVSLLFPIKTAVYLRIINSTNLFNQFNEDVFIEQIEARKIVIKNHLTAQVIFLLEINDSNCLLNIINTNTENQLSIRRKLGEYCDAYTDCYNCSVYSECFWCSAQNCIVPGCKYVSLTDTPWWYSLRKCTPGPEMTGVCPSSFLRAESGLYQEIILPPIGYYLPINGFCFWEIYNSRELDVEITITRYAVFFIYRPIL